MAVYAKICVYMLAICAYVESICRYMQAEMCMLYAEICKCAHCMQTYTSHMQHCSIVHHLCHIYGP